MNINSATIDRIVADVLAQLDESPSVHAERASSVPSGGSLDSAPATPPGTQTLAKAFDLDLSHTGVLVGDMLESLDHAASIRVSKNVVLTPSAREIIAKRSLVLIDDHDATKTQSSSSATKLRPQLFIVSSTPETRSLADRMKQAGWSIDYPGCDGDAIKSARSAVCRGETNFVAIIAPKPNRTAQRLNRTRNVLAAAVFPETSVGELQSEGEWNVACLAADRWASFRLTKTLDTLAKGAAR